VPGSEPKDQVVLIDFFNKIARFARTKMQIRGLKL